MSIVLHHADCFDVFSSIKDESIDLILCDPPYGSLSCKWDTVLPFSLMWKHLERVIKPKSAIVLFANQPFNSALIMSNPTLFKYEWVWNKVKPGNIFNTKICPLVSHETISVFGKGKINYYPQKQGNEVRKSRVYSKSKSQKSEVYDDDRTLVGKYPKSILTFSNASQRNKVHPTQKPVDLLEYLIKTYSLENETVLDFTMGSGSTGVACKNTNRNFIGIEKEYEYYEIAKKRILTEGKELEPDFIDLLFAKD